VVHTIALSVSNDATGLAEGLSASRANSAIAGEKSLSENEKKSERKASERSPNDQSSDVHNPTSAEHQAMLDNRSRQIAANKSRGKK
jgi:hypothetical protein